MPRLRKMRLILVLLALLAVLVPVRPMAQDDPNGDLNDRPLGDVARNLRKKIPPSQKVIDDDNLSAVMAQAESQHAQGSALNFMMTGEEKVFHVSAPDVTCSLAFTANVKSLLSSQYAEMELPPGDVLKLEGPATIAGNVLIVAVLNRTDWHVSEVTVALTVFKKSDAGDASSIEALPYAAARLLPAVAITSPQASEAGSEKGPDATRIYRMRAAAPPSATTVFSAPLNWELAPDEEWHWAIVQARGYPPQSYAGTVPPATQASTPATAQPTLPATQMSQNQ
jgi:hypothetical protein